MTLIRYDGPRGTRYGFRFWNRGNLHKRMVGSIRAMAVEAEKRERRRLDAAAFAARWGPLEPALTSWDEAIKRYVTAKADKRSLDHDRARLTWWQTFLVARRVHYLQSLTPDDLEAAKAALARAGRAPATITRYLAVLRHLCQLAVRRWHLLERNPVLAVDWPQVRPPEIRIPTAAERARLLRVAGRVLRPIILTALYTGLRKMAIMRLTAEDLTARPGRIRAQDEKGRKTVWIPMVPTLATTLGALRVKEGPLFHWEDGQPMRRFPWKRWVKARTKAGLPWLRFHDLRHTVGELLAEEGVPLRLIQEFLGHSSSRVTERYTKPREAAMDEVARTLDRTYRAQNRRIRQRRPPR